MPSSAIYPTHRFEDFLLRPGHPFPFGATAVPGGVNFAIFSRYGTTCTLVLYEKGSSVPIAEVPFPDSFRIGNVFSMIVFDLDDQAMEYGFRIDGPFDPKGGHRFDSSIVLLDPYAKSIHGRPVWGHDGSHAGDYVHRAMLVRDDFDWVKDRPLETPIEDLIIYEVHVRGFTRHPSSNVRHPGTFAALREKIPYLKSLGINCVELMPIHEFDETETKQTNPETGERLLNYWGYSPVGFFAPKASYAATGRHGLQVDEFKALVKLLHRHGIEVILDVCFNHTAEGDESGPTISFRGIDNKTYYMLTPEGHYYNFSGCGNTLNCNNPVVRSMVLDCLRYWAAEYHIDGFRFDLASIMGRDPFGRPLANPPLLEALAHDPVLGKCKLIAEAWDAGGLYQVGSFPAYGRWSEWNGRYRDTLRRFLRGDLGQQWEMAQRIIGSPDLYAERGPLASINFVTCHDGFTLADLFAYDDKHNEANGEGNRDGTNENFSWNCGVEGPADDPEISALRWQVMRNAVAILAVSQGVPMLLMGDEAGRTKRGNNNTYCHDNELNWFNWDLVEENGHFLQFVRRCLEFRQLHPVLRSRVHLRHADYVGSGLPDVSWHGVRAWVPAWSYHSRTLAMLLCGKHARGGTEPDDHVYVAMNMHWEPHTFELPHLPENAEWYCFVDTSAEAEAGACPPGQEPRLSDQSQYVLAPRTVLILVGKATAT